MRLTESIIKRMEKEYINYCEGIITPDGDFRIARYGHINELILVTGETNDEIYAKMPVTAGPLSWLCMYTNCVIVNYDNSFCSENITREQKKAYRLLVEHRIIKDNLITITRW